jgi:2-oxoisovalerate dehydrogenase E1 component
MANEISRVTEVIQRDIFAKQLQEGACKLPESPFSLESSGMSSDDLMRVITAGMATSLVHTHSRIASLCGEGFYTIGPGGEELIGAVGLSSVLRPSDSMALHYRHVATQLVRQLEAGREMDAILLDRARGHCVSAQDPVTGGVHCAIGGGKHDFLVTSTLASQVSTRHVPSYNHLLLKLSVCTLSYSPAVNAAQTAHSSTQNTEQHTAAHSSTQ